MADRTGPKKEGSAFDGMTIAGKYVVRDVIGEGGMGVVLAAENTAIQLPVAIKLLHKVLVKNETSMERFQREARAAAATGHSHIVEIYDMGETEEGAPFIVMEMLDGKNLQQVLRKEKVLEPERAAKICIQLLSALSAVHAKGILHRDLKPANVILVEKKRNKDYVKLVDFGISKIHEHGREQSHLTATGVVMGTPHYMSPEQARGEKDIDHRADLYAVGAILYRCVCGKVPYPGKNYNQILAKILAQPPPPVLEVRPQAPPRIATIINRAMARHPESRYESAAAFAADLADFYKMDISVPTSQGMRASAGQMDAAVVTGIEEEKEATAETVAVNHRAAKKPMNPPSGVLREASGGTPQSSGSWRPARNLKSVPQEILSVEQTPEGTTQQMGQRPVSSTVKMARGKKAMTPPESLESVSTGAPTNVAPGSAPEPADEHRPLSRKPLFWIGGIFVALLLALGLFFAVRGRGGETPRDSNEKGKKAGVEKPQKKPLSFALGQHLPAKKRRRIYHDVGEYLKKHLKRPVQILTPEDLTGLGKNLVSGHYDLLALSPLLYVKMKRKHPEVEVIATPRFRRAAHYQGLILARSEDGINELSDLKGKRFCWVSRHSTSGYLFPRLLMRSKGLDPDTIFSETLEAGRHIKALRMLEDGKCDGASVYSMRFMRLKSSGGISTPLKVVASTPPIPDDAICASPKLEEALVTKVKKLLMEFDVKKHGTRNPDKTESAVSNFLKGEDSRYDIVRKALKAEASSKKKISKKRRHRRRR